MTVDNSSAERTDDAETAARLLYVDDQHDQREATLQALAETLPNTEVVTAADRGDALGQLSGRGETAGAFDLVVLEHAIADTRDRFLRDVRALVGDVPLVLYTRVDAASLQHSVVEEADTVIRKGDEYHRRFLVNKIQSLVESGDEAVFDADSIEATLDTATTGVFLLDADGDILWQSSPLEAVFPVGELHNQPTGTLHERIALLFTDGGEYRSAFVDPDPETVVAGHLGEVSLPGTEDRYYACWSLPVGETVPGARLEFYREITTTIARRRETDRLETLVELSKDMLYATDEEGRYDYVNEAMVEKLGYDREELLGRHGVLDMGAGSLQSGQKAVQRLLESDATRSNIIEQTLIDADGEPFTSAAHSAIIRDEADNYDGLVNVSRDVTEQKEREQMLERYRTLVETATDPMYVLDDEGRIEILNEAMAELLGGDQDELVGDDVRAYNSQQKVERAEEAIRTILQTDGKEAETYEIWATPPDGKQRLYEATISVITDDGEFTGSVGTFRDITERRRDEKRLREHERKLQQQNEKLEEFVSMITHHLRNPLGIAELYLEFAAESGDPADFDRVETAIDRIDNMIERLLTYARIGGESFQRTDCDLEEVLERAWADVETTAARLETALDGARVVHADAETLALAFENLFANAVVHNDGPVTVTVGTTERGLYVEDDGQGIDADTTDVFDHGFTTREEAAGFGLSIVEETVTAHGWDLELAERDDGTRFEIHGPGSEGDDTTQPTEGGNAG